MFTLTLEIKGGYQLRTRYRGSHDYPRTLLVMDIFYAII